MQVCAFPSKPSRTDTVQVQQGWGTGPAGCAVLAHPDLGFGTHALRDSPSWRIPLRNGLLSQVPGTMWHPRLDLGTWMRRGRLECFCPLVVEDSVTRRALALELSLFTIWCSSRREDPRRCTIGVMLSSLQERLERRLSPSTLKVYAAAIAAHHVAVDGWPMGKHNLIVRFLRGARRLNPPKPPLVPSWNLSIILAGVPLSHWTQLSWSSCLLRQHSWPCSLPSRGSGTSKHWANTVLCIQAGLLSHCPETPAWICAKGSQHALPWLGGEPESTALGGGRFRLGIAVSRKSEAYMWTAQGALGALSSSLFAMEVSRKGRLSSATDSGCHRRGIPISRRAMLPGGESSLHTECCFLICIGAQHFSGRHL